MFLVLLTTSMSDRDPVTSGLITDETALEFTSSGSNTQTASSTPSYRRTESNSCLDNSHDGAFAYMHAHVSIMILIVQEC